MLENRDALEMIKIKLPHLYQKFVEADQLGIRLMVSIKIEQIPTSISENALMELSELLLENAMESLRDTKAPILYFLMQERDEFHIQVAHTVESKFFGKICLKNSKKLLGNKRRLKQLFRKNKLEPEIVPMTFRGRDCVCYWIHF